MGSSCSHWWHVPLYLAMSLSLAFVVISTAKYPTSHNPHSIAHSHSLAINASRALRLRGGGGFHITATLLLISPELFLSSPQTTLFAIPDAAISNLSLPPSAMRHLLRYHAVPATLPTAELLKKPPGFCLKTLAGDDQSLAVTNNTVSIAINDVLISHPDMFLHGPLAVHGVAAPFDATPRCGLSNQSSIILAGKGAVQWRRIIRVLSSNGFVSFAIGLNAVLDGILQDYANLASVTVFAPPNSDFLSSPSPFLDRIVRLHILQRSFSYVELSAAGNSSLTTLVPGSHLQIANLSPNLAVNGVEITRPDVFSSDGVVVHGISRDFNLEDFFTSFK